MRRRGGDPDSNLNAAAFIRVEGEPCGSEGVFDIGPRLDCCREACGDVSAGAGRGSGPRPVPEKLIT